MTAFQPGRRTLLGATAALATTPLLAPPALAQGAWPDRPIRIMVGFSAGGPTDTVARLTAQGFAELLGQPCPVENRTGAAGNIATEAAARLHLSVRAVTYRLARVAALTGHDPADPADRFTLQTAVAVARLLGWPQEPLPE